VFTFTGREKTANAAATSCNLDPAWYTDDSITTDHIISDLDKLTMHENYSGQDQMCTTNGTCMMVKHVGQFIVATPYRYILLQNILHVPQAA
jgi:hypothetical protein